MGGPGGSSGALRATLRPLPCVSASPLPPPSLACLRRPPANLRVSGRSLPRPLRVVGRVLFYLIAKPVYSLLLKPIYISPSPYRFILLACDGLFKVFTPEEAVNFILSCLEVRELTGHRPFEQRLGSSDRDVPGGFLPAARPAHSSRVSSTPGLTGPFVLRPLLVEAASRRAAGTPPLTCAPC